MKNVIQNIKCHFHGVKNIVGKGEKCWLPAFSPFPTMFSKVHFLGGGGVLEG